MSETKRRSVTLSLPGLYWMAALIVSGMLGVPSQGFVSHMMLLLFWPIYLGKLIRFLLWGV